MPGYLDPPAGLLPLRTSKRAHTARYTTRFPFLWEEAQVPEQMKPWTRSILINPDHVPGTKPLKPLEPLNLTDAALPNSPDRRSQTPPFNLNLS